MIFQPINQVRLTNVAIVRYKHKGKRFELACYKNKVMSWRKGVETDLDEVLQVHEIFINVSKGVVAKKSDLKRVFGEDFDEDHVIERILSKGEVQVSEKERKHAFDAVFRDIATIINDKCINSDTKKPFSVGMIETAMRESHISVSSRPAKQQALSVINKLRDALPGITRAQMRVLFTVPSQCSKPLKDTLHTVHAHIEDEQFGVVFEITALIEPGRFQQLEDWVKEKSRGKGYLQVLDLHVRDDNDSDENDDNI